jgi:hypothetical protein
MYTWSGIRARSRAREHNEFGRLRHRSATSHRGSGARGHNVGRYMCLPSRRGASPCARVICTTSYHNALSKRCAPAREDNLPGCAPIATILTWMTPGRRGSGSRQRNAGPERLRWAKGLLRDFSSPEGRDAVSAAELRAIARSIIGELDPSVQSKTKRTHRKRADAVDVQATEHPA